MTWNIAKKPSKITYHGRSRKDSFGKLSWEDKYPNSSYLISAAPCVILPVHNVCLGSNIAARQSPSCLQATTPGSRISNQRNMHDTIWEIHMTISEKYTWQYLRNILGTIREIQLRSNITILPPSKVLPAFRQPGKAATSWIREIRITIS